MDPLEHAGFDSFIDRNHLVHVYTYDTLLKVSKLGMNLLKIIFFTSLPKIWIGCFVTAPNVQVKSWLLFHLMNPQRQRFKY